MKERGREKERGNNFNVEVSEIGVLVFEQWDHSIFDTDCIFTPLHVAFNENFGGLKNHPHLFKQGKLLITGRKDKNKVSNRQK